MDRACNFAVAHSQDTGVGNTANVLIVDEAALPARLALRRPHPRPNLAHVNSAPPDRLLLQHLARQRHPNLLHNQGLPLRPSRKFAQVCSAELTHEFDHKTRGGLAVWLPAPRPGAVERRTKGESGAPQARKFEILPVGKMKHAFGVDETVLPTGKSCSWCGSVLESTNRSNMECAEEEARLCRCTRRELACSAGFFLSFTGSVKQPPSAHKGCAQK